MAGVQLSPKTHFYRRPLPPECISFCSAEGKTIFKEALGAGFMENYFNLAAQFRTQDEPAFCGLSTLVMVLNSLEVDPGKVWKGPWRWYHENMLDCCVPINVIAESGITFDQLSCLAICNTLKVKAVRADNKTTEGDFRTEVKRVSQVEDEVMVVSYSRTALGQSGGGHFSPIGGYHPVKDLVLIMDVARFKYPPHWVSISSLFQAMQWTDKDTGKARGYMSLMKSRKLPTIVFRLNASLCVTGLPSPKLIKFAKDWRTELSTPAESHSSSQILKICINQLLGILNAKKTTIITSVEVIQMSAISDVHKDAMQQVRKALENLPVSQAVKKYLPVEAPVPDGAARDIGNDASVEAAALELLDWHYVSMLLLIWPYDKAADSYGGALAALVKDQLEKSKSELLQNEVRLIRQQMASVLDYATICSRCPCQQEAGRLALQETLPPQPSA